MRVEFSRLDLNEQQLQAVLNGEGQPVYNALKKGIDKARDRAVVNMTSKGIGDTGTLRSRTESSITRRGRQLEGRVTAATPYARYVHDGTQGPIHPRTARALRFKGKGGRFVFARSVQGTRQTGKFTPFLKDAADSMQQSDFM